MFNSSIIQNLESIIIVCPVEWGLKSDSFQKGKSSLSVHLAKLLCGEIIGLDSLQIYKGMPIGTAQPTKEDMDDIPHHLFGFWNTV